MTINQIESLFLWMTLVNFSLLIFSTIVLIIFRDTIFKRHGNLLKVAESQVAEVTCSYQANLKVSVIVFDPTPLLALLVIN